MFHKNIWGQTICPSRISSNKFSRLPSSPLSRTLHTQGNMKKREKCQTKRNLYVFEVSVLTHTYADSHTHRHTQTLTNTHTLNRIGCKKTKKLVIGLLPSNVCIWVCVCASRLSISSNSLFWSASRSSCAGRCLRSATQCLCVYTIHVLFASYIYFQSIWH